MSVVPNYTIGASAPNGGSQGDFWYDTTNGHLNLFNGVNFVQISMPALGGLVTASQAGVNGAPMYIPACTGTLGGSWNVPPGYVGLVYDMTDNRLCMVGSGGHTFKTVAFA